MATITQLRKAGWTAKNVNEGKPGCSAYWQLKNARGFEVEIDLGESRKWIVSYNGGRDGYDVETLGRALEACAQMTTWKAA